MVSNNFQVKMYKKLAAWVLEDRAYYVSDL